MATYNVPTGYLSNTSRGRLLSDIVTTYTESLHPFAFPDSPPHDDYLEGLVKAILAITASAPGHHYSQLWNLLNVLKNEEGSLRGRMAAARVEQPVEAAKREFEQWHARQQVELLNNASIQQARLLQQQRAQWQQLQKQQPQWNGGSTTSISSSNQTSSTDVRPISGWFHKYLTTTKDKP